MAIMHLSQKIGKRAKGKNAVFAVAYIRGEQRTCLRTNEAKDFSAKQGELIYSNCILPTDAPEWATKVRNAQIQDESGALTVDTTGHTFSEMAWNQIELMEKRQDAQLYFHYDIAIPIELEQSDAIALIEQYVQDYIAVDGFFCDVAIHWDLHNPHAHLVTPMRTLTETGYSNKIRMTRQQMGEDITAKRAGWAKLTNQMLMARGIDARIDHRSNEARGIQLIPTVKIGKATHMTGSEHQQLRISENQAIRAKNYATIASSPDILATKLAQEHHTFSRDTVRDELQKYAVEKAVLEAMRHNENASREKIVADIIEHLSEQEAVFSERALKTQVLERTNGNADFEAIVNAVTAAPAILSLGLGEDGRQHYVTRAAFDLELSLTDNAKALGAQSTFTLDKTMAAQVAKPFGLNPSQKNAFDHIVHGANAAVITGFAGTGKTYMLNAARAAWEQAGYRVRGVAFSGRAAEALGEDAKMKTMTCAGFLYAMKKGYIKLGAKDVLVMDEMGMTSLDDCEAIIRLVKKAGAKFVGVGDTEQTQPVGRGAPMRTVIGTIGASEMSTIVRHQGPDADWMTAATLAMETRQTASALDAYQQRGYVQLLENFDAALDGSVAAWAKHIDTRDVKTLQETILIAAENDTVAMQNRLARQHLMDAGYLKTDVRVVTKAGVLFVAEGERLLFGYGAKPYKARNGQFGTLTRITAKTLLVTLDNQKQIELPRDKRLDMTYGYAATTHKLQGFTGDRAIPLIDSRGWDRHKTLVAASRHRFGLEMFADLETFEDYDDLREVLSREGLSDSVIDYPATFALRRGFDSEATGKRVVAKVREHLAPVANAWLFLTNYAAYLEKHPVTGLATEAAIAARRKRAVLVAEFADTRIALAKTMTELVPLQDAQAEHLLRFALLQELGLSPLEHQVMRKTLDDAVALIPEIERLQQVVHLAHIANAKRAQTIAADIDDFKPALDKNRVTLSVLQKAVAVGEAADTIKDVVARFHLNQFYAPKLADTITTDWSTYYPHIVNAFPERHWLATLTSSEKTCDDFMATLAAQADNHRFDTAVATFGAHHKGEIATLKYYADLHRETVAKVATVQKNEMRHLLPYLILQEVGFSPVRHTLMREMLAITAEAGVLLAPEKAKLHQLSLKRDRVAKACIEIDDTERRDRLFAHFGLDIEKVAAHATRVADRALVKCFSQLPESTYDHENRLKQRLAYTISQAPKRYGPYLNDFFKAQDDDSDAPDGWQTVNLEKWRYQRHLARVTATPEVKPHLAAIDAYYQASRQVGALWQRAICQRKAQDATVLRHLQGWDFSKAQTAERLQAYQANVQARLTRSVQTAQQAAILRDKAAVHLLGDVAGNAALLVGEKVPIQKVSAYANAYQLMQRYRQSTDESERLSLAATIMQSPKAYQHYIGRFGLADTLRRDSHTQALLTKTQQTLTPVLRDAILRLEAYDVARRTAGKQWAALKTLQKIAGVSDTRQCPAGLQPLLREAKAASLNSNRLAYDYVQYCDDKHLDVNCYGYAIDCDNVQMAAKKHLAYEHVQAYLVGDAQTQVRLSALILDNKASYQYCYEFEVDFTCLHRQAVIARTLTAAEQFPTLTAGDIRIATDYAHMLQTLSQQYQALKTERNRLRQINDAWGNALDIETREPLKMAYPTSLQLESVQQTVNQLSITRDTLAHQLMSTPQLAPLIDHFRLKSETVAAHAERYQDRQALKAFDILADSTWQVPNLQKQARAHHFKIERQRYGVHFATTLKNGWRDVNLENWRYEQRMAYHALPANIKADMRAVLRYKAACRDAAAAWKTAFAHKAAHKGQHPARSYQIAQGRSHFRNKLASQLVANGLDRYEPHLIALKVDIAKLCERQHTFDTFTRYLTCDDPALKRRLAHGLAQNMAAHRAALAVHPLYADIQKEARLYQYLQQQKAQPTTALLAIVDMLEAYRTLKSRAGKAWYDAKALEAKSHKKAADAFTVAAGLQSQRNEAAFKVMRYIHDSQGIALGEYAIDVAALEKAAEQHVAEQAVVAYQTASSDKKGEAAYYLLQNRSAYHFIYRHGIDFKVLREQSDTWLMSDAVTLEAKTETQVIERKRWDVERIDAALRADPHTFYRTLLGEPKRADSKTLDYGSGLKVELRGRYAGNWRDWAAGVGGGPIKALEVHQGLSCGFQSKSITDSYLNRS